MCPHNLLRMRYSELQNAQLDHGDANHKMVPGEKKRHAPIDEQCRARRPRQAATEAKRQQECLRLLQHSCWSCWQNDIIHNRH